LNNVTEENPANSGKTGGPMRWLRREAIIFAVMMLVGLLLPIAIFHTGTLLLGEYTATGEGVRHLYGDIFADLFAGSLFAWLLILGPWLGILMLRILWWPLSRRRRRVTAEA
jgi:hypothetical protein